MLPPENAGHRRDVLPPENAGHRRDVLPQNAGNNIIYSHLRVFIVGNYEPYDTYLPIRWISDDVTCNNYGYSVPQLCPQALGHCNNSL